MKSYALPVEFASTRKSFAPSKSRAAPTTPPVGEGVVPIDAVDAVWPLPVASCRLPRWCTLTYAPNVALDAAPGVAPGLS